MDMYQCMETPCDEAHAEAHKVDKNDCLHSDVIRFKRYIAGELSYQPGAAPLRRFSVPGGGSPDSLLALAVTLFKAGWHIELNIAPHYHGGGYEDWGPHSVYAGLLVCPPGSEEMICVGQIGGSGYRLQVGSLGNLLGGR